MPPPLYPGLHLTSQEPQSKIAKGFLLHRSPRPNCGACYPGTPRAPFFLRACTCALARTAPICPLLLQLRALERPALNHNLLGGVRTRARLRDDCDLSPVERLYKKDTQWEGG